MAGRGVQERHEGDGGRQEETGEGGREVLGRGTEVSRPFSLTRRVQAASDPGSWLSLLEGLRGSTDACCPHPAAALSTAESTSSCSSTCSFMRQTASTSSHARSCARAEASSPPLSSPRLTLRSPLSLYERPSFVSTAVMLAMLLRGAT